MATFTIFLDGAPYCGESDATEPAPPSGGTCTTLGGGHATRSRLLIGTGEPIRIQTARNLTSHVERILTRMREGGLSFDVLTIQRETTEGR